MKGKITMSTNENRTPKNKIVVGILSLVFAALAIIVARLAVDPIENAFHIDSSIIVFCIRIIIAIIPFIIFGGKKWMRFDIKNVGYVLKFAWPMMIIGSLGLLVAIAKLFMNDYPDAPKQIAYSIALVITVGINEETIFRGLVFCGLLFMFGKTKKGMYFAAALAAAVFGYVHVMTDVDFSNLISVITALLKTVQCGMFGFVLCYCCLHLNDIWGAAVYHFLYDWFIFVGNILDKTKVEAQYVGTDTKSLIKSLIGCGLMILISLPPTIKAAKGFKAMEINEGPFSDEAPNTPQEN